MCDAQRPERSWRRTPIGMLEVSNLPPGRGTHLPRGAPMYSAFPLVWRRLKSMGNV